MVPVCVLPDLPATPCWMIGLPRNIVPHSLYTSTARVVICAQGPDDGVFQDPDIYCLSLLIELRESSASPLLRICRFVGSNDDVDAQLGTRILHPGKSHYFVQPRTFVAALVCGMTNIKVESMFEVCFFWPMR
jgi:hypothetical protein